MAEDNAATPDFSAVTPRELREFARANFDSGKIDQETYSALSEELPMHAVDARGQIIDLTGVTDGTSFDFLEYYRNQLELAMSIGDDRMIGRMQSVMAFLRSASIV